MAGQYQKMVTKQYNSPIQVYSERNIREILEKETRVLANGTIGIDFNNPMINKPANLQNSAVLRMLEEEENRRRNGQPGGLKRVAWPPSTDSELEEYIEQEPAQSQGGLQYPSKTFPGLQSNRASIQQPITSSVQLQSNSPIVTNNTFQSIISPTASSPSAVQAPYPTTPLSPNNNKSPVSFTSLVKPWSPQPQFKPVQAPVANIQSYQSSKRYEYQCQSHDHTEASIEESSNVPLKFKPTSSEQSVTSPIQYQPSAIAQGGVQNQIPVQKYQPTPKQIEPPPSTITLRPQAPVNQVPPPLVTSQPATATLRGGKHLRGDLKWPPENVRERMAAEEQHLIELSKGPAIKPRKQCKDYSSFFAKHALNSTYPGYKIPPGTQFYDHNPVM